VDLAILAIPEEGVEEAIKGCGEKGVRGITIITAGYKEAVEGGADREKRLVHLAHSRGIRPLGPNVSGTFNLHAHFNAAASPAEQLLCTDLASVCQGGYAIYDLLASAFQRGMGVGRFIHTGNECDLTVTDFLAHFGRDPQIKAIVMYLETVRDGKRFMEAACEVAQNKPVVVYKGGRTAGSARAARSHTGALAGKSEIFQALAHQTGITLSPTMELLIPLGHALVERPPMKGKRVVIVTMGGSWGVALSDSIEEAGLVLPELSPALQEKLRSLGMPPRASTRNPVDIGASGIYFSAETMVNLGREILISGEVDAMVLHGVGRPGLLGSDASESQRTFVEINKNIIRGFAALEGEVGLPVLVGSHHTPWESQEVFDLNEEGIRIYSRLDDIAHLLCRMCGFWRTRLSSG
jgi:acyl-CoA synthetase (NDP forming)